MGKFLTTEMFEEWRQERLRPGEAFGKKIVMPDSSYEKNPRPESDHNPIEQPRDPRAFSLAISDVFMKTRGVRGHCPDCDQWGDWACGYCPGCGLTISKIIERARKLKPAEPLDVEDPDLSWPGDGMRWDNI